MNSFIFEMIFCKRPSKATPKAMAKQAAICTNHQRGIDVARCRNTHRHLIGQRIRFSFHMPQSIEYYFSISSPWAYLGLERLIALGQRTNVTIEPLPITTIDEHGWIPMKRKSAARQRYGRAEIGRWSRHLGIAMQQDRPIDIKDPTPAARMVVAAGVDGKDALALSLALQRAYWERAADIGAPAVRGEIADAMGYDGQQLLDAESSSSVAAKWQDNRTRAIELGVFGSPTYVFDGELYWGQDRLDFLERHVVEGGPA